jgi:hypothetical protein
MVDPLSPENFSTVIASIYDCALDPARWEQALADIRGALNCQTAVLGLTDVRSGRTLISKNVGMEPYWLQQLEEKHGAEIQAATSAALAASSLDDPLVLSRFYPPSRQDVSPYVQECLKPQGLVDVLQYVLIQMPTRFSVLGAARHERQGLITEREMRIGGLLLPHIRRGDDQQCA